MKLTPEEHGRVIDQLDLYWPKPRLCPICRDAYDSQRWNVCDTIHMVKTEDNSQGHKFILVSCSNCGHTYFFHAVLLGIIKEPPPAA
jgi:predicted nucleic-acid-binding Zn-ribbon protein